MMSKVGIITYHFARNYGAALQCYALWSFLQRCGHDVYVIDYFSDKQEANNSLHNKRSGVRNIAMNIALAPFASLRAEKERRFKQFESMMRKTPRLKTLQEFEAYVGRNEFDVLISGSDQVFNPRIGDFEEAFFLPIEFDGVKASFAASLGFAEEADLAPYAYCLNDFDYLGIREGNSCDLIARLAGKAVSVVPDPVFLLGKEEWSRIAPRSSKESEKGYVLCYYLKKEKASEYLGIAEKVAKSAGLDLKVINARYSLDSFRKCMIHDAGPAEFINLFSSASYVCTDSFHGTAFSIIFEKPFISFEPSSESSDMRKRDLLAMVGESGRSVFLDNASSVDSAVNVCLDELRSKKNSSNVLFESQREFLAQFIDLGE